MQPVDTKCESAKKECLDVKNCPYGIEKWVDKDGCERCGCYNPCREYTCPSDQQCAFDVFTAADGSTSYKPICRLSNSINEPMPIRSSKYKLWHIIFEFAENKPGSCGSSSDFSQTCGTFCKTDADCAGDQKCCHHNCGSSCAPPLLVPEVQPVVTEALVTTTEVYNPPPSGGKNLKNDFIFQNLSELYRQMKYSGRSASQSGSLMSEILSTFI